MAISFVSGKSDERPVFSPQIIRFMAALCIASLAIAAFGRLTGIGVQQLPGAPVIETRELRFLDAGRGVVDIRDAVDDTLVRSLKGGEGGFIRTVVRGLAHDRMARGGDSSTPFKLMLRSDDALIIRDDVTGREVLLGSFGKPNREVFAHLLKSGATSAAPGAAQTKVDTK